MVKSSLQVYFKYNLHRWLILLCTQSRSVKINQDGTLRTLSQFQLEHSSKTLKLFLSLHSHKATKNLKMVLFQPLHEYKSCFEPNRLPPTLNKQVSILQKTFSLKCKLIEDSVPFYFAKTFLNCRTGQTFYTRYPIFLYWWERKSFVMFWDE